MDRATLAAYEHGAAAFARDWHEQPPPVDLQEIGQNDSSSRRQEGFVEAAQKNPTRRGAGQGLHVRSPLRFRRTRVVGLKVGPLSSR